MMKDCAEDIIASSHRTKDFKGDGIEPKAVNPTHYTDFTIPPNVYITENNLCWEVGNAIKYVTRFEKKNGEEDLRKAIRYIELLIDRKYPTPTL